MGKEYTEGQCWELAKKEWKAAEYAAAYGGNYISRMHRAKAQAWEAKARRIARGLE